MRERRLTIAVFNEASGWALSGSLVERLRESAPSGVSVQPVKTRGELIEALPETDYLVGFPLTEGQFAEFGGNVKWIQLTGTSGESLAPLRSAMERGVRVSSAGSIRAPQTAEHAIALILALRRQLHVSMRAQVEHNWAAGEVAPKIRDLESATVGLLAMDAIGEEIAHRVKAFGCEVVALSDDPEGKFLHVDRMLGLAQLDEFMRRSDVVVVATPFGTPGLSALGKRELSMMSPHAILVDVSRGGVVKHGELVELLRRGVIAGAGLDVFEHEPLAPESPLWSMGNVIVTPHVASASPRYWDRAVDVVRRNVARIEQGKGLLDEVLLERVGEMALK
ncbi:MAG: D-2-hydroxyacid dehydrogenase [Planctomycetota bacterium]|nr:D-2-hydroxyacid dehydrogenase [Planctomycetota bacterium]